MAQREDLGGIVIPGVTSVDPGMTSPSIVGAVLQTQARANMLAGAAMRHGPAVPLAMAAAYLVRDSVAGALAPATDPETIGRPSQAALDMAARLGTEGTAAALPAETATAGTKPDEPV
jgi:hypothetical protein